MWLSNYGPQEHAITVDMACTDMAILEHSVVKSHGGGVYQCGRLLLSIVNAAKEMGYTALHNKPEKATVLT